MAPWDGVQVSSMSVDGRNEDFLFCWFGFSIFSAFIVDAEGKIVSHQIAWFWQIRSHSDGRGKWNPWRFASQQIEEMLQHQPLSGERPQNSGSCHVVGGVGSAQVSSFQGPRASFLEHVLWVEGRLELLLGVVLAGLVPAPFTKQDCRSHGHQQGRLNSHDHQVSGLVCC